MVFTDPARNIRETYKLGWLYQARRINTQTAVGGGALRTRISIPAGQVAHLVTAYMKNTASATSTMGINLLDEDSATNAYVGYTAAGANRELSLPSIGTAATADSNRIDSNGLLLGPGSYLSFTSSVAVQNEIMTVGIVLLLSTPTEPTWDTTGSAGTPSLAASTISEANTLQLVNL